MDAPARHEPGFGFRAWRQETSASLRGTHSHPDVEINFLEEGRMRYLHGGRLVTVPEGRMAVFWAGMPHQWIGPPGLLRGVWLTLPIDALLAWKLPGDLAARLLGGEVVIGGPRADDAVRFAQWVEDFDAGGEALPTLWLEVQARLRRLATEERGPTRRRRRAADSVPPSGGEAHLERVVRVTAQRYREPLTVADIAREVRLHPNYLMRLFRRQLGMTVWEYVTRLRLAEVQRRRLTERIRVLDAALESGFGSAAAYYAARARHGGGGDRRCARMPEASAAARKRRIPPACQPGAADGICGLGRSRPV